ncbi:MAG: hypothetical protein SFW36_08660 [Leptolyngbyaceae cyanobacterium bins.59]|nr:hypothetical protein [Leptolyngbyaceae cyanobacterium bins.59]
MNSSGFYSRQITSEEQRLYDHLLELVNSESPGDLIERFRMLFIEGVGYQDRPILTSLDKIISSKNADHEFKFVLNRCCHILINRWQTRSQLQGAIPELIAVFTNTPSATVHEYSRYKSVRRLRELVGEFQTTDQYHTLCRLSQVLSQTIEAGGGPDTRPLGTLIRRYPYLYEHCLLSEDSGYEHQQTIRQIQTQVQRQFELDLSRYVTYQVRRSQANRVASGSGAAKHLTVVKNPTLLNDGELSGAIRHFVGKVEGSCTYRDLAQRFLTHSSHAPSYGAFKDDLYQYVTATVDSGYSKRQFGNQLHAQLKSILPESNGQKLSDFLIVRTCSQLLNFLVVESSHRPQHFVFIDLINNVGPTATTGILLKIVLICRKVKPYLEKRFSILFNHYEASTRDVVQWLVQALENLNVALSTNFGNVDLSFLRL